MSVDSAPPTVFDADLPTIAYETTESFPEVYPRFKRALQQGPIALGPYGPEILSYDLCRTALRDNRFQIPPGIGLEVQGITEGPLWDKVVNTLLSLDGPQHQRLRSLLSKAFTPRAVGRLHHTITEVINELIDDVADQGQCEIVADIARPYPIPVICSLIGAPREHWQKVATWADDIFRAFSFIFNPDDTADVMRAWGELDAYTDGMIADRRDALTDDLLSDLIRVEDDGDRLSHAELLMLVGGLLLAGTDTTRNQVAASIDILCDHPGQWELLREHPNLAMAAVDETMRHCPVVGSTLRQASEDFEFGGVVFPKDAFVIVNTAAANRDPLVYDDPDEFDITRGELPPILSFGAGVHYCLGANLARLEVAEALTSVTRRMRNPRKTGPAPWKPMVSMSGPLTLPIAFDR